ncbi:MAG: hypothetical protein ACRYGA_04640 [Janthinobacterium lividum]
MSSSIPTCTLPSYNGEATCHAHDHAQIAFALRGRMEPDQNGVDRVRRFAMTTLQTGYRTPAHLLSPSYCDGIGRPACGGRSRKDEFEGCSTFMQAARPGIAA